MAKARRNQKRTTEFDKHDFQDRFVKLCKKMKEYNENTGSKTLFIVKPKEGPRYLYSTVDKDAFINDYLAYSGPGRRIRDIDNNFLQAGNSIGRKVGVPFVKRSYSELPSLIPKVSPFQSPLSNLIALSPIVPTEECKDDKNPNLLIKKEITKNVENDKWENIDNMMPTLPQLFPLYNKDSESIVNNEPTNQMKNNTNIKKNKINNKKNKLNNVKYESEGSNWEGSTDDYELELKMVNESEEYSGVSKNINKKENDVGVKRPTTRSVRRKYEPEIE